MERIKKYARRVRDFYVIKKDEIRTVEEDRAKELVTLVLEMFEAGAREDGNMLFDKITLEGGIIGEKIHFLFKVKGIEYNENSVSDYRYISKVAEKLSKIEYDPRILYNAKEYYELLGMNISNYYIDSYTSGEYKADLIKVTFGIKM